MQIVQTVQGPKSIAPSSPATIPNGFVFTAGQIALDPATMEVVAGGIKDQTTRVMANLKAILEAAGSSMEKVVKTTIFLIDMTDFMAMNEVYGAAFGEHRPARSTVAVSMLPRSVRVEIEAVATL